jgi:DNA-binding transcriptional LysR family regulator
VRITAPPFTCADFLGPFAGRVRDELPGVRLEIISATGNLDLVRREADIALRRERPGQRDLVIVQSLVMPAGVYATPAYRRRLPKRPKLADIGFISWAAPLEHLSPTPELTRHLPGFRPVFASNDILVQLAAAEHGVGAIVLPRVRHRYSRRSPLELLELDLGERAVSTAHLVVAKTALEVPPIRAVVELLQEEMNEAVLDRGGRRERGNTPSARG